MHTDQRSHVAILAHVMGEPSDPSTPAIAAIVSSSHSSNKAEFNNAAPDSTVDTIITTITASLSSTGTSDRTPLRYSRDFLMSRQHINNTPLDVKAHNTITGHKIHERTYESKRQKLMAHRSTRERPIKNCYQLPTIYNINCRSVCNKREELHALAQDSKADVLVLTETWVTRDNEQVVINDIKMHNNEYDVISARRSRNDVDRGGGIIIMVRKSFSPTTTVISTTTTEDNSSEFVKALIVQTHQQRKPREYTSCLIAGVYIPPESSNKSEAATSQLNELINNAKLVSGIGNHPLVFVAGDLNKSNISTINQAHNLRRLNKKATRGKRLLDPILTNAPRCYHAVTRSPLTPQCDTSSRPFPSTTTTPRQGRRTR